MPDEPTPTPDERKGLPSASGMERLALCPGSWQLEQKCPPLPPSEYAEQGTRLHKVMELHDYSLCENEEEKEACIWCNATEQELRDRVFGRVAEPQAFRELRLWNNAQTFSGQPDVLYICGAEALVLDYKFGKGEVTAVEDNVQLAALAVLVADNYPQVRVVYASILQPFAGSKWTPPMVSYEQEELNRMRIFLSEAFRRAGQDNPKLVPGAKQCLYCRASMTCPAMDFTVQRLSVADFQNWELTSPERKRELWSAWKACQSRGKQLEKMLREDMEKGLVIPGLAVSAGRTKFEVTDPNAAFSLLNEEFGMTPEEFSSCCKVSLTSLDDLFHPAAKKAGLSRNATQSKAILRERLAACGQWKQEKGSIMERREK